MKFHLVYVSVFGFLGFLVKAVCFWVKSLESLEANLCYLLGSFFSVRFLVLKFTVDIKLKAHANTMNRQNNLYDF